MVNVPTIEEFDALEQKVESLEARVVSLENNAGGGGTDPSPIQPGTVAAVEAAIAELMQGEYDGTVTPVWIDKFQGSTIDTAKWNNIDTDYGTGNGERQCYEADNSTIDQASQALWLTAEKESKTYNGKTYPFKSGMVTTRALNGPMKFKYTYGYWEVEAAAPHGDAYWPAFWLVGPSDGSTPGWPDYGEFDIVELIGVRPDIAKQTLHYKKKDGSHYHTSFDNVQNLLDWDSSSEGVQLTSSNESYHGPTTELHRYGFWWEPGLIAWVLDGKISRFIFADTREFYKVNSEGVPRLIKQLPEAHKPLREIFNYPHSIILNLAVGGGMPENNGYPGDDKVRGTEPDSFKVNYVKVFDNEQWQTT